MRYFGLLFFLFFNTIWVQAQRLNYPDVLNLKTTITKPYEIANSFFSDLGAWHAYALPEKSNAYGGFIGPLVMQMHGAWLSKDIAKLHLVENGKEISWQEAKAVIHAYPGLLQQTYTVDGLHIELRLIFISNRASYLQTIIHNNTHHNREFNVSWTGKMLLPKANLQTKGKNLEIFLGKDQTQYFSIRYLQHPVKVKTENKGYKAFLPQAINIKPGKSVAFLQVQYYDPEGIQPEKPTKYNTFKQAFQQNKTRWNGYLNNYFSGTKITDTAYSRLAVKAIETLVTNWRSAAGDLEHGGAFPSASYQGFYGFWSWDTWKIAAGMAYFAPKLAEESIWAMFDYQQPDGMIPDVIYFDKKENNLRDTKPPLTTWAVAEVFKQTHDTSFVEKIYPKLKKYHSWWYKNRDYDHNGLCEYGSTDGTRIAAAWESGMDNAVRFDGGKMLQNNAHAWSLNQESVDLNAYLYQEKVDLAKLAIILNKKKEAHVFVTAAKKLKKKINKYFYDKATGYYYDRKIPSHQKIKALGPEGWTPLYVGIARKEQAISVMKKMINTHYFNTYMPLPTVSVSNSDFDPTGYWRGLVWWDQIYFGLVGLRKYEFYNAAKTLENKAFTHAQGLLGDQPIRENYNPMNGKGMNAKNFGWSSAHILMLLKHKYTIR